MKTMIVITGLTCSGKTYMTFKLKEKYGWGSIHTDLFYSPLDGNRPNSVVGVDDEKKRKYFKENTPTGDIFIIEGSHAGNRKELELYKEYLDFNGDVLIFEAKSNPDDFGKWFATKYSKHGDLVVQMKELQKYWQGIYDAQVDQVVYSWREINCYIKSNVHIPR